MAFADRVALLRAALLYGALVMLASIATVHAQPAGGPTPLGVDAPHIALLLPVDSSTFRRHAEALRDGFIAASQVPDPSNMMVRVYPVGEDPKQALAGYRQAVGTGARLVVGPLVRGQVNAVAAGEISVPTLLLNAPEGPAPSRPNLFVISLQIEAEARQVAQLAYREGRRSVYTVSASGQVLQRVHQAFVDAFVKLGGRHVGEFRYAGSLADLDRLREAAPAQGADMVFLALDAQQAQSARGAITTLPMYASSQTYSADPAIAAALSGVRVLDMPWLLQPEHPAVMIYPRPNFGDADLDRLYALGIDAWRIGQAILARHTEITLDGVTGQLSLGRDRHFTRELVTRRAAGAVPTGPVSPAPPLAFPPATRPSK